MKQKRRRRKKRKKSGRGNDLCWYLMQQRHRLSFLLGLHHRLFVLKVHLDSQFALGIVDRTNDWTIVEMLRAPSRFDQSHG